MTARDASGRRAPLVCHWNGWDQFLARWLFGDERGLAVSFGEDGEALAERVVGADPRPAAVVLHLNATRTQHVLPRRDRFVAAMADAGVRVLNAGVLDLSKTALHAHNRKIGLPSTLASRDGPPGETLIFKTQMNSKAIAEDHLTDEERALIGTGPRNNPLAEFEDYPVIARADAPAEWWDDERVIAETYVDNRAGRFYRLYVAGPNCLLAEGASSRPVRRMNYDAVRTDFILTTDFGTGGRIERALLGPLRLAVVSAAVRFASTLGLDYGCLDVVVDDAGEAYVVDATTTPHWGDVPVEITRARHLRAGLA